MKLPFDLYIYDLETFRTCFLFVGKFVGASEIQVFEISRRRNQRVELLSWLSYLQNKGAQMLGFNTLNFDYPIIHNLLLEPYTFDELKAYVLAQKIIDSQSFGNGGRNSFSIGLRERIIPQIDLMKINHFDNRAKSTSLKSLQFAMRSQSVEDLPYAPDAELTDEQMDHLIAYGCHDVTETEVFAQKCMHLIEMRQELLDNGTLAGDVLNFSDVKIGTEYLIKKIGRGKCFVSGSNPRQTFRTEIPYRSLILPKVKFRTEPFENVHEWFKGQTLYVESDDKPKLETPLAGLPFVFGVGGVHASVENRKFESNRTHVIKDIDVSGMYVAVAIANGFAPEHLGRDFSDAYRQLQRDRAAYPKGSTMNAVLKLAGNGVYGNSNNKFSCFYDPKYTFSVTVNGQLQLLQLVEMISLLPGVEIIQANTDGITVYMPREIDLWFQMWKSEWEKETGLKLEEVPYTHMWIRDVNNYLARTVDGKMKRKGAYWYPTDDKEYEGWWNKDFSNIASIKAVEQVLLNGWKPEHVIRLISNPYDFMLRAKTPNGAKIYIGEKEMLKTVRYYVSTQGEPMKKVAKPKGELGGFKRKNSIKDSEYQKVLAEIGPGVWDERIHTKNRSVVAMATTSIQSGRLVRECNRAENFNWSNVDYDFYTAEIRKLIIGA